MSHTDRHDGRHRAKRTHDYSTDTRNGWLSDPHGWRYRMASRADKAIRRNAMQRGDYDEATAPRFRSAMITHRVYTEW